MGDTTTPGAPFAPGTTSLAAAGAAQGEPPDGEDPFADLMGGQPGQPTPVHGAPAGRPEGDDPFSGLNLPPLKQDTTSPLGAFAAHAALGVAPMAGGMVSAGAGAEAGAEAGGAIGSLFGPVGTAAGAAIGGFAGGVAGFMGGSYATGLAQNYAIKQLPTGATDELGISAREQRAEEIQHPYWSFLGGVAPYAMTMAPGVTSHMAELPENATAFQRLMANPLTAHAFGGVAMGGMELGQEEADGQTPNWAKVGISTGFGLVFGKETRFGEYLTGLGTGFSPWHPPTGVPDEGVLDENKPTVAQGNDLGVVGPGATESTFMGTEARSDAAQITASNAAAEEQAALGPVQQPDVTALARRLDPEAFAQRDQLLSQRDDLRSYIADQSNPPDSAFDDLALKRSTVQAALDAGNPRSPDAAQFRAQLKDLGAQLEDLQARRAAWASGQHVDSADVMLARQHLQDTEHQLWDLGPRVAAAMRRAADYAGQEDAEEPTPPAAAQTSPEPTEAPAAGAQAPAEAETQAATPEAPAAPTERPIPVQIAGITEARARQLMAAGRPRDVAWAEAAVEAHYYATLSQRFGGALGDAEQLFGERAPTVRKGRQVKQAEPIEPPAPAAPEARPRLRTAEQIMREDKVPTGRVKAIQEREIGALADWQAKQRGEAVPAPATPEPIEQTASREIQGKIRIAPGSARSIITLMRNADASTFLHEAAHDWLKQLLQDAAHPAAPEQLQADAAAVRGWLRRPADWAGFDATGRADRAPQEKFARAFEQYLREGVAPSKGLARVFAQFRDWLTTLYRTLSGLGTPISDEIRGVFDRLLAFTPERTVIAEEPAPAPSLAATHEAEAADTEPAEAEAVGDRVFAEGNRYEAEQPQEVRDGLDAATEPTSTEPGAEAGEGAGGRRALRPGSGEPEPGATRGRGSAKPAPLPKGRGNALPQGAELAGAAGDRGADAGRPRGADADIGPESIAPDPAEAFTGRPNPRLIDLAGNIRVENLTDVQDIAQAIHDSADRNGEFRAARGRMTPGQMLDLANAMQLDPAKIDEQALTRLLGGTQNLGARILAARKLVVESAGIVADLMRVAAESENPSDLAELGVAIARHDLIQSALSGATAEWGRAGRAFRSLQDEWQRASDVDALLKQNLGRDLYQLKMIAKMGKELDTPGKISKYLRDARHRSFGRMLLEYWINGLLSGISTHTTYVIGNAILASEKAGPETAAAAAIGAMRERMGRQGERIHMGEVGAQFRAAYRELPQAVQAAIEAWRTGVTTLLPGEDARPLMPYQGDEEQLVVGKNLTNEPATWADAKADAFALVQGVRDGLVASSELIKAGGVKGAPTWGLQYSPLGSIPGVAYKGVEVVPLGHAARLPSRNIAAIHSTFRSINYSMDINALAYRKAIEEGAAGATLAERTAYWRQNPSEQMMEQARSRATHLTLMEQGGRLTQALSRLTNTTFDLPVLGETQLLKFVDPFVHIAGNIVSQALLERTPLGLLAPTIRADLAGKNGNVAQDMAAARMLMGSIIGIAFGGLAAEGLASGSGPSNPNRAAMWRLAGNQAHSVRIGDMWYDIHRLGPMGLLLSTAADFYDVAHGVGREPAAMVSASLMHAITQNVLDESFVRGPADLINALTDPGRYGPSYIRNTLATFVPYSIGLAQVARASDPWSRQARTIMDAIRARVPGMSESLWPRRDIWGDRMPSGDALIAPGVTAIYAQRINMDPVNQALVRLGIGPAPVGRTIRNVHLTGQQYDDYARVAGRTTKMRLDAIVRSPDWQDWPNETKHLVVEEVIRQSREAARGWMMMKYPNIAREAAVVRRQRLAGEPIQ